MSGQGHESDAELRALLRGALPEPPLEQVDWAALRQRIARDAEPGLARLRRSALSPRAAWWDYAARWAMPALPAALAAAAALTLLLGRLATTATPEATTEATVASPRLTMEAALGATPTDEEVSALYAAANKDALLRVVASQ